MARLFVTVFLLAVSSSVTATKSHNPLNDLGSLLVKSVKNLKYVTKDMPSASQLVQVPLGIGKDPDVGKGAMKTAIRGLGKVFSQTFVEKIRASDPERYANAQMLEELEEEIDGGLSKLVEEQLDNPEWNGKLENALQSMTTADVMDKAAAISLLGTEITDEGINPVLQPLQPLPIDEAIKLKKKLRKPNLAA